MVGSHLFEHTGCLDSCIVWKILICIQSKVLFAQQNIYECHHLGGGVDK